MGFGSSPEAAQAPSRCMKPWSPKASAPSLAVRVLQLLP